MSKKNHGHRQKRGIENKRYTYGAMRRAAEVGATHGYYMAYMDYGLKAGESLDIAALTNMSMQKVREHISKIEGVGFHADGNRLDVLKEIVEIADSGKGIIASSMQSPTRKKKRKSALRLKVEELNEVQGMTQEGMVSATKTLWMKDKKSYNSVKHKKAIYDALRKIDSKLLNTKE